MHISKPDTAIALPPLPYGEAALAPVISARTLSFHYGKHHAGYVATLNKLLVGSALAGLPLVDIVRGSAKDPAAKAIYHNAAQVWNHNFYWTSMKPDGGGAPQGALKQAIDSAFGSFVAFRDAFVAAALGEFGSGWIWLVARAGGPLEIRVTSDADTPLTTQDRSLVTLDVWEHAYYLDFQNRRADYIAGWLDHLVDWRFAERNLG
jgi:Fe-Mn family superoxide dismutase